MPFSLFVYPLYLLPIGSHTLVWWQMFNTWGVGQSLWYKYFPPWLLSSYQCDIPEFRVRKRCTPSASSNQFQQPLLDGWDKVFGGEEGSRLSGERLEELPHSHPPRLWRGQHDMCSRSGSDWQPLTSKRNVGAVGGGSEVNHTSCGLRSHGQDPRPVEQGQEASMAGKSPSALAPWVGCSLLMATDPQRD